MDVVLEVVHGVHGLIDADAARLGIAVLPCQSVHSLQICGEWRADVCSHDGWLSDWSLLLLVVSSWLGSEEVLGLNIVIDKDLLEQIGVKFGSWILFNFLSWSCLLSKWIEFTNYCWTS